jgi:hypothetical protein
LIKYLNVFDKNKCVKFLKYFVNNHEKFKKWYMVMKILP